MRFVTLNNLMPYLMIFFIASIHQSLDIRKTRFFQVLDLEKNNGNENSIYNCLINQGIPEEDLFKRKLTYRQVETFLMDYRMKFPQCYSYESMNLILIMVREKMDVDPISRKEKIKESFFPDYDDANSCQLTFAR